MPCDEIRTTTVDLANADLVLLIRALESDGWAVAGQGSCLTFNRVISGARIQGSYDGSTLSIAIPNYLALDAGYVANTVKRAYSAQVVVAASLRYGWRVQQKAPNRFAIQRRA